MKRRGYRSKKANWYKPVKYGGKILRSAVNKNPLKEFGKLPAYIYKKMVSPKLSKMAYKANGKLGYKRGSNPTLGSIRYTFLNILINFFTFKFVSRLINIFRP